jgi:cytochrome c oxidase subunit 2
MTQIAACNSWMFSDRVLNRILPWLPRTASLHGAAIDRLMDASLLILFALCVLAQVLIVAGLVLRRERHVRFSTPWRWGAIALVVTLFAWMTVVAEQLWSTIRIARAASNAVRVEVTGVQFQWYFRYPGPDGIYGRTGLDLIDAAAGNPLGIDPADPHSHDDVVSSVLILPVDRQVDLHLRAQDVVHGFYIPAMRLMQNATPGTMSEIHFTPTRTGDYPIVCSQLCGLGHYRMRAVLRVVPAQEFTEWMQQREKNLAER